MLWRILSDARSCGEGRYDAEESNCAKWEQVLSFSCTDGQGHIHAANFMSDDVIFDLETSAKAVDNALAIESWANTGEMEATVSVHDSHKNLLYNLGIWC